MNILCNTLLPNDRVPAVPADIGKVIKPTPVIDKVTEVDVVPITTFVSTDSKIVLEFYNFHISGFIYDFFKVGNHFFNIVGMVIKTINIFQCFFLNHCSK